VDPLLPAIQEPHVGLADVERATGHALEADHQLRGELLLLETESPIEGALPEGDAPSG
jgi:hypothetical protein